MKLLKFAYPLLAIILFAQISPAAEPRYNDAVQRLVNAQKLGKKSTVGISIVDVQSGELLCDINGGQTLMPASNMKLLTTGAALILLGDKHNFTTSVYSTGEVTNGTLNGHLVVVADGDPAISGREHGGNATAVFDAWAADIAKTIKVVRGDLIIDDNAFDRQYLHPSWPENQLVRWYCAPVSALALNDNCVDVTIRPTSPGRAATVIVNPATKYFEIRNSASTIGAGKNTAVVNRLQTSDVLVVSGNIADKAGESATPVAVLDPAGYAGTVLRERLEKAGVTVQGKILLLNQPSDVEKMKRLTGTSHSLITVITTANKRSQNFYAEMLLKTCGRKATGRGSFDSGSKAVTNVLAAAGIPAGSCVIDDGSGLSRNNKVSANQFTIFLRYMANSKYSDAYINSLAISGEQEASLHKRLVNAPYAGKVHAKTGTIAGVSALSGYVISRGKTYAFSVIANGAGLDSNAARNLQDSVCKFLVDLK